MLVKKWCPMRLLDYSKRKEIGINLQEKNIYRTSPITSGLQNDTFLCKFEYWSFHSLALH